MDKILQMLESDARLTPAQIATMLEKEEGDIKNTIKSMFNSIRHEKIPYLQTQKKILIKELKKQFDKTLATTEKNLANALEKQKSQTVNKQLQEKRKNLLLEYSELEQYAEAEAIE